MTKLPVIDQAPPIRAIADEDPDALATGPSYGVVMPTPAHLGHGQAAGSRRAIIAGTGRRLMLIRGKPSRASARTP